MRRPPSRHALAGVVSLALAGVLAVMVLDARSWVQPVDDRWLQWMLDVRWSPLTWIAKALDLIGGGTVMWILRVAIAGGLAVLRRWRALVIFALAEACAELCIGPIKAIVDRPRPAGSLVATSGQAFPSGHALTASVTALVLVLILVRPGRARLVGLSLAAAWSIVMAASRTYLGAHWMTDSLASLLLGTGWALLWAGVLTTPRHPSPDQQVRAGPSPSAGSTNQTVAPVVSDQAPAPHLRRE